MVLSYMTNDNALIAVFCMLQLNKTSDYDEMKKIRDALAARRSKRMEGKEKISYSYSKFSFFNEYFIVLTDNNERHYQRSLWKIVIVSEVKNTK